MTEQTARQMLPEVKEYVEIFEAAVSTRNAAEDAAGVKYPQRYGYGEDARRQTSAYREEVSKAYDTCAVVQADAWEALKASGDPLVKWIAENSVAYREQARCILAALPATIDELDDLAEANDFCGVWDEFRQQAIAAGVVSGSTPPSPARKAVFERINEESCCRMDSKSVRRIDKALDALVHEALTGPGSATAAKHGALPA
ncbi:hypothetical protein ACWGII_39620 [Streptomyces sp. NPDC054855]